MKLAWWLSLCSSAHVSAEFDSLRVFQKIRLGQCKRSVTKATCLFGRSVLPRDVHCVQFSTSLSLCLAHPHPCHCRVTVPRILCPFTSPTRAKKERSFPSSTNGCSGRSKWGSNPHPYDQSVFRPSKPSGIRHAQVPLKGHLWLSV